MNTTKKFYNAKSKKYKENFKKGSLYEEVAIVVGQNKKILDIGCANGLFGKYLKKKNNVVYGVEISDKMAIQAKKNLNKVFVLNIEKNPLPFKNNEFDVILCMDILEHLFDPREVLKKLKNYLKPTGLLIVTVPNAVHWSMRLHILSGKFNYEEKGLRDSGHIRFFTSTTALSLFKNSGYVVESYSQISVFPFIVYKINHQLRFLNIHLFLSKVFPHIFAYQYMFLLKCKK